MSPARFHSIALNQAALPHKNLSLPGSARALGGSVSLPQLRVVLLEIVSLICLLALAGLADGRIRRVILTA